MGVSGMAGRVSYDEVYDIRLADYDEIDDIMAFIDTCWKHGHILGCDRAFFEYEMVVDGQVDFIIARRRDDRSIDGIYGFLPCSKSADKRDVWGVMWKTRDSALPLLGMELKKRLKLLLGLRTDIGVGANKTTSLPLLTFYGYYTTKLKHYYCLSGRPDYRIAVVKNHREHTYEACADATWTKLTDMEQVRAFLDPDTIDTADKRPHKDAWYFKRRFFDHPIYTYEVWGITGPAGGRALVVTRRQPCNGSAAIRIVDYEGDQTAFAGCGAFLDMLLREAEYVDFYFAGFDESCAEAAGMREVTEEDGNIIPDYFHPFEPVNADIYAVGSEKNATYTFFKADGDQDRPVGRYD